jgi:hypothetical protein
MRIKKLLPVLVSVALAFSCAGDETAGLSGQAGSMTRFAVSGNYLYLLENPSLKIFNLANGAFEQLPPVHMQSEMETLFANGDFLYMGANDAMYIYSLSDPSRPAFVFRYRHIASCDPVVVQGTRAYVTLRSGNACNRGVNALEIIDISNPFSPVHVTDYAMSSPHGLGVDGNLLFLCEGPHGLKVFDITDELNIKLVQQHSDFFAYDVIARAGVATVTGEDGIFQFSYGPDGAIELQSSIPVERDHL